MSRLLIRQYEIGPLNNFIYLLGDPETKEMAIVDPAWDVDFLCQEAKRLGYKITQAFLTHTHPDHINGLDKLLARHPMPVYISPHEPRLSRPRIQGLREVSAQDQLTVGKISFDVLLYAGTYARLSMFFSPRISLDRRHPFYRRMRAL